MKQMNLWREKRNLEFGGSLLKGRRKGRRPISTRRPLHLVLKATNSHRLLRNRTLIDETIYLYAARFGLRIYAVAVHADHIHLSLRVPEPAAYRKWIRAVTSRLVSRIQGLKWRLRPYTKIVAWGKGFLTLKDYIAHNHREAEFILQAHRRVEDWVDGNWEKLRGAKGRVEDWGREAPECQPLGLMKQETGESQFTGLSQPLSVMYPTPSIEGRRGEALIFAR